ncbi:MAG: hypothetical protein DWQ07_14280 [Chloroflexi bacterium]|nr:MAG: hypothetical protein DWQ07_14280 [Chloroflexota bacterium]MBL1195749.1 hypothetical protein [Chloroflexota bacterium]
MTMAVHEKKILLTLANPAIKEVHYFNDLSDIGALFWMPDGKQIGFITIHSPSVFLIDLETGEIDEYPPPDNESYLAYHPDLVYEPYFLNALGSSPSDENFSLIHKLRPGFFYQGPADSNGEFYATTSNDSPSNYSFFIEDISTGERIEIAFPIDQDTRFPLDLEFSFSPTMNILTVRNANTNRMSLYEPNTGNLIRIDEGVTTFTWSQNGKYIAYDPQGYSWLGPNIELYDYDSTPCILNVIDGTKQCPGEIREHVFGIIDDLQWSPDSSKLGFIGSDEVCFYDLLTSEVNCITSAIPELHGETDLNVVAFLWSLDSKFVAFNYDRSCSNCDYVIEPKGGIVSVDGSYYHFFGEIIDFFKPGLWRPSVSP